MENTPFGVGWEAIRSLNPDMQTGYKSMRNTYLGLANLCICFSCSGRHIRWSARVWVARARGPFAWDVNAPHHARKTFQIPARKFCGGRNKALAALLEYTTCFTELLLFCVSWIQFFWVALVDNIGCFLGNPTAGLVCTISQPKSCHRTLRAPAGTYSGLNQS